MRILYPGLETDWVYCVHGIELYAIPAFVQDERASGSVVKLHAVHASGGRRGDELERNYGKCMFCCVLEQVRGD